MSAPPNATATTELGNAVVYRMLQGGHPAGPEGQLARTRDGRWFYRRWEMEPASDGSPRPELLRPDLVHLLTRFHELRVEVDGAYAQDDEGEADRFHELTSMLCTPEADRWIAALYEAMDLWESARPVKTFETAHMWIQLPPHLAQLANGQLHP